MEPTCLEHQPPSPAVSGIDIVRVRWNPGAFGFSKLLSRLYADDFTWMRWRGVSRLKACEALALHHHLDPDALNLGRVDLALRQRMLDHFGALGSGGPLEFAVQLRMLSRFFVRGAGSRAASWSLRLRP